MKTRIAPLALAAVLALGATACDGNAADDLENIEENVEQGADEVGDAVEDGTDEVGDDDGSADETSDDSTTGTDG